MPLPLDTFREILGLNSWHFWQFADSGPGALVPIVSKCSTLTYEYDWQGSDAAGRATIRDSITTAEWMFAEYVGYRPMPEYVDGALVDWPRAFQANLVRFSDLDATGRRVAVQAPEGYVLAMGIEQLTLLATATVAGGELVYSALFNAALEDTFTITIPNTLGLTDAAEIAVYVAAADRWDGSDASERWRIEPVQVRFAGGNIVITGRKWLCGKPILYQNPVATALDPTNSANFVTGLEVYQRTTNGNGNSVSTCQATLVYETSDCGAC